MDDTLRHRISYRLSGLQSENGEALFERVSAEIARRRIHANIQVSALVAGHGDQGPDFENVPGSDPGLVGPQGRKDGIKPGDAIVGACTLGRSDAQGKIRSDIRTIHDGGPKPDVIDHFCETDFPTTAQTDLRKWCEETCGTRLHILTGNTLADWLWDPGRAPVLDLLGLGAVPAPRCVLPPVDTEGFRLRAAAAASGMSFTYLEALAPELRRRPGFRDTGRSDGA